MALLVPGNSLLRFSELNSFIWDKCCHLTLYLHLIEPSCFPSKKVLNFKALFSYFLMLCSARPLKSLSSDLKSGSASRSFRWRRWWRQRIESRLSTRVRLGPASGWTWAETADTRSSRRTRSRPETTGWPLGPSPITTSKAKDKSSTLNANAYCFRPTLDYDN